MANIAILGNQAGDEGKGHITHHFSKDYDWIIRFSGGANAGHTIYRDGVKYVHNLMPSFDWRSPKPKAFLASGMVIDLLQLSLEVSKLADIDSSLPSRVYVDPNAFLVLEEHKEEDKANNGHIGSTNRGIGPAYKAKIERRGKRIHDVLGGADDPWLNRALDRLKELGVQFKSVLELRDDFQSSKLLYEGAQGILLDINHGIYPYVSCGDSTVAGIYSAGFHFAPPEKIYGVAKCYTTKVGEGPFPTELHGSEGEELRKRGNEYGATTGRPRRVGWLDIPALDYACKVGGITDLILTKFDILSGMDKIPVCTSYQTTPKNTKAFFTAIPNYLELEGWATVDEPALGNFISFVESSTNCPVRYISTGTSSKDIKRWPK